MFSVRGPKLKIFAGILAVIVLIVGVYMTFFQSRGFVKTTAGITDVRMDSTGESAVYYPTVEYTVVYQGVGYRQRVLSDRTDDFRAV